MTGIHDTVQYCNHSKKISVKELLLSWSRSMTQQQQYNKNGVCREILGHVSYVGEVKHIKEVGYKVYMYHVDNHLLSIMH